MATFTGQLNVNHIQSALFNMIIAQDVIGGSIKANYKLYNKAEEQVGLYGDTKLYIDVPTNKSVEWVQDSEDATNLLALDRPEAPKTQAIVINKFRQVRLTKDDYLSKQAFGTETAFVSYQSVLDSRMNKAKEMYMDTKYNSFIGTVEGEEEIEIDLTADGNTAGQNIAYEMSNLIDDMKDYNTKYTANGFIRAFGDEDIHIVWNKKYQNAIRKLDLPEIFHNAELEKSFVGDKIPSRYFGTVQETAVTAANNDGTYRSLEEMDYTVSSTTTHVYPGDLIPAGAAIAANASYVEDEDIICKVFTKLPPVLEAFSVGTSFFNAKNLSTNKYLTFGLNTLEALDSEAIVTVKKKSE